MITRHFVLFITLPAITFSVLLTDSVVDVINYSDIALIAFSRLKVNDLKWFVGVCRADFSRASFHDEVFPL